MTKPIRWGILGAGHVAQGFASGLKMLPDANLAAVASRTLTNAQAFAGRYSAGRVHTTALDLARDPNIDVVYVATPHHRHAEDSILCLEHGKAVLCEKPFTLNAAQAREVVQTARRHNLFCMEAMWMRFIPAIRKAKELVESGAIGQIRMLSADFCVANSVDPRNRQFDPAQGGGALLDLGVYPLALASLFLGPPERLDCQAAIGSTGVDEQSAVLLGYAGSKMAVLSASLRTQGSNQALIMGSKGSILIEAPLYCPSRLTISSFREAAFAERGNTSLKGQLASRVREFPAMRTIVAAAKPLALTLLGRGKRTISLPISGNGYNYQAAEVMRRLRADETESPLMPLDESLQIVELMDRIRAEWGLQYPGEGVRLASRP
jgi:predicted dehydrogenase